MLILLLLSGVLLLVTACATTTPVAPARTSTGPPFSFGPDTFAFRNDIRARHPDAPAGLYANYCFVLARGLRQFFQYARFDPEAPRVGHAEYVARVRAIAARPPWAPALPPADRVVIPGYAHLRAFSTAEEAAVKEGLGGPVGTWLHWTNWRVTMPVSAAHQARVAGEVAHELDEGRLVQLLVTNWPVPELNHTVVADRVADRADRIDFTVWDPNAPDAPGTVTFDRIGPRFWATELSVAGRGMGMGAGFTGGGLLPARVLRRIAEVDGVSGVQAQVMLPLNPTTSQFMTLTQELVLGLDLGVPSPNRYYRTLPVRAGRFLREGDRHVTVLGDSLAASRGLGVGGRIVLEGQPYDVVGILDRMMTAPDRFVIVSIADAREQWVAKDGMLRTLLASGAAALTAADLNTGAAVGWRDGYDPDAVARSIRATVDGVNVQLPGELSRLLRQSTAFFSALLVGIGALAFVIGGLSLANTIAAAVFERVRDFGVKRALGASDLQLGREVLGEALAVTLSGGAAGVAIALALGLGIDAWAARTGQQLFYFSPRLLAGALIFSVLLGAAAAVYATARIVRLSPADAIRRGA